MIVHGDCLEVMAGMEPESVDAIVTDPPYNLTDIGRTLHVAANLTRKDKGPNQRRASGGFMGKSWDGTSIAFRPETWESAYRVAKPSAYLLAFGGTRTVHRMTVAIEDAGWIIRDMLVWAYASGFPKSKASLKPAWEPIVMARKPGPLRMLAIDECRIAAEPYSYPNGPKGNVDPTSYNYGRIETPVESDPRGRWPANVILTDPIFDGGVDGVVGGGEASGIGGAYDPTPSDASASVFTNHGPGVRRNGYHHGDSGTYSRFFSIPITMGACRYCGVRIADETSTGSLTPDTPSGIAPSPASSPRSSSRNDPAPSAPSRSAEAGGSIARPNAALWDAEAGASNSASLDTSATETRSSNGSEPTTPPTPRNRPRGTSPRSTSPSDRVSPADLSATSSDTTTTTPGRLMCASCAELVMRSSTDEPGFAERPDPPRFFLIPKSARSDREPILPSGIGGIGALRDGGRPSLPRENQHPTVKPTDLMRHLVRLVTPAGGTVLDPFLGSGTTGLACELEGFPWIGIEKEAEYVAIAEARLNGTQRGMGLSA